jgi:hypothetical protein
MKLLSRVTYALSALALASIGSSCNLDPVHRASVNNLGDENANLYPPESEFHRPGEPCALCHSNRGPADSVFVLGGTIFGGPDQYRNRVDRAYVRILDANKTRKCFVTNCNGNFFVRTGDFQRLTFPLLVSVERTKNPGGGNPGDEATIAIRRMSGHIGREASCATCHIQGLRDFASPGQIRLFDTEAAYNMSGLQTVDPCPNEGYARLDRCPEDRQ